MSLKTDFLQAHWSAKDKNPDTGGQLWEARAVKTAKMEKIKPLWHFWKPNYDCWLSEKGKETVLWLSVTKMKDLIDRCDGKLKKNTH